MKELKVFKIRGLKIKTSDLTYELIKEEYEYNLEKGNNEKAEVFKELLDLLNKEKNKNPDTIEKCVNKLIDDNIEKRKELKEKIKALKKEYANNIKRINFENQILSSYSKREMEDMVVQMID